MPSSSPRKGKGRYSDPSIASLTPLRSAFSRASTASRAQSLSPRKRRSNQPLHIRMNLTESQMDKITDAFTRGVDGSPTKSQTEADGSPGKSTASAHKPSSNRHQASYNIESEDDDGLLTSSTTFSELMPRFQHESVTSSLAERRQRAPPAPINVTGRRPAKSTPYRPQREAVPNVVSPLSPQQMYEASGFHGSGSSSYPSEHHPSQRPVPLNVRPQTYESICTPINQIPFDQRRSQNELQSPFLPNRDTGVPSPPRRPRRSKSTGEGLGRQVEFVSPTPQMREKQQHILEAETPMFSPFPFYFRGEDFPTEKKGEKTMIGEKGWLERTDKADEIGKKASSKRVGILDGIKKIAKDMTEMQYPGRRSQVPKEPLGTRMPVSLGAREQSLLYGELEFHLSNSLNLYITAQFEKGRLVMDKLKKIDDTWYQQGRPRIVGFRYDLETQLDLVHLHIDEFVFCGRRQGNPVEIAGLLHAMKVNARSMRIRTFCQPDTVITKQMVDSQSLFNLIGVTKVEDHAMAEIARFLKVCLEKEQNLKEQESTKARKSRMEHIQRQEDAHVQGRGPAGAQARPRGYNGHDEWL